MSQDDAPPEALEEPRRYPSTIGGALYIAVLVSAGAGLLVASLGDWRLGVRMVAASLGAAGVLRLLLPEKDAGMLAVRHRLIDVAVLVGLAYALYYLADDIPDQPA